MTTKHTPGPWHYQTGSDVYTHIVRDQNNRYICGCSQDSAGSVRANAILIASAPELLEAAKESLDFIIAHIPEFGNEYLLIEKLEEVIKKAEAT